MVFLLSEVLLLFAIILIASLLQTSTGYGFSIIGTPFLLLLYPAPMAIQINIILSICLSAVMFFNIRDEIDNILLKRLIKGSLLGLFIGILIYLWIDIVQLKRIVGIIIILVTLLLIFNFTIQRSLKRDILAGGLSGVLTTSIGVPGPPLLLYFAGTKIDQVTLRSTTLAYYLFVYTISLLLQITLGGTNKETWFAALLALPFLFIGIVLGQRLFKWISPKTFRLITYSILLITGAYLALSSL